MPTGEDAVDGDLSPEEAAKVGETEKTDEELNSAEQTKVEEAVKEGEENAAQTQEAKSGRPEDSIPGWTETASGTLMDLTKRRNQSLMRKPSKNRKMCQVGLIPHQAR